MPPLGQFVRLHRDDPVAVDPLRGELGERPGDLSHGAAHGDPEDALATLQQVAGAAGAALLVAIMASRTATLTAAGQSGVTALNAGLNTSFLVAAAVSVGAIVLARRD